MREQISRQQSRERQKLLERKPCRTLRLKLVPAVGAMVTQGMVMIILTMFLVQAVRQKRALIADVARKEVWPLVVVVVVVVLGTMVMMEVMVMKILRERQLRMRRGNS